MVALVNVETLVHKLANVEAKALVNTLAGTLREIQMQTLGETHDSGHTVRDASRHTDPSKVLSTKWPLG